MKADDLKLLVKEKYGEIALKSSLLNQSSCCGTDSLCCSTASCGDSTYTVFSDEYSNLEGYNPEANLGLGCGLPTKYADIKTGDHVLDLGSGAGNDCFVARSIVGEKGKVTGLDFTEEMLTKARENAAKLNYNNLEFVKGDIEEMPLPSNTYDVVISNCVLNLVPDKKKAFAGIFRVLKNGGHFCISDVVLTGELPESLEKDAVMYAGCVAGAQQREEYIDTIRKAGFRNIMIRKEKQIELPDNTLLNYMTAEELKEFKKSRKGIFSITITAEKI